MQGAPILAVLAVAGALLTPAGTALGQPPSGVVGVVGASPGPTLEAARAAGGARWRAEPLRGRRMAEPERPDAAVSAVREAWEGAEFQRCAILAQEPALRIERLLPDGFVDLAAQVAVYAAGCARPVDPEGARRRLLHAAVLGLPIAEAAAQTRHPPLIAMADDAIAEASSTTPVTLSVSSEPEGARVEIDGGRHVCDPAPCELRVPPGEHVLRFEALGSARRVVLRPIEGPRTEVRAALDPASADLLRAQLDHALAVGRDPESLLELASQALGASVVVLAWEREAGASAAILDRRSDQGGASRADEDVLGRAVRSAILGWRARVEPFDPIPWIVGGVIGLLLVGTGVSILGGLATAGELTERSFVLR